MFSDTIRRFFFLSPDSNERSRLTQGVSFYATFLSSLFLFFFPSFLSPGTLSSQSLQVNSLQEEQVRIQQLLQGAASGSTMTSRPISFQLYRTIIEGDSTDFGIWSDLIEPDRYSLPELPSIEVGLYAPSFSATHNSSVPYGWNNESSWYGKGLNTRFSGGFWLHSPYLSISFRPQISRHQNLAFEPPRFIPFIEGETRFGAEAIADQIDRPYRFGDDPFEQFDLGQSSIRFHYRQAEVGLSTEPLWWGPSLHYPLLLSNNAPGLRHLFAGTRSPVSLPRVGRLEFRLIGAFPESSRFIDDASSVEEAESEPEFSDHPSRFMSGALLSFSPAFAPNLTLGWARVVHTHLENGRVSASDFGMLLDPILLEEFLVIRGPAENLKPRNHLTSLFARWVWPESRFELYGEFMRNDFSWDTRDALMQTRHNSAYAFGFQKLLDAPGALFYRVNLEFTNLTPSFIQEVRPQFYFYAHPDLREGHTNRGQLLGAAIGPGSNSQSFSLDSYQEWGRFGLFFRRLADNNHFHFLYDRSLNRPEEFRQGYGDYWRHRTDLTVGARALYRGRSFVLTSELSWTKLFNYGRYDYGRFGGLNIANFEPYDVTNVQIQVGLIYLF